MISFRITTGSLNSQDMFRILKQWRHDFSVKQLCDWSCIDITWCLCVEVKIHGFQASLRTCLVHCSCTCFVCLFVCLFLLVYRLWAVCLADFGEDMVVIYRIYKFLCSSSNAFISKAFYLFQFVFFLLVFKS